MAKKAYSWQKKSKSSLLALEPRMLFDGAAAATPAPEPVIAEVTPLPEAAPQVVSQPDNAAENQVGQVDAQESIDTALTSAEAKPVSFYVSDVAASQKLSEAQDAAQDKIGAFLSGDDALESLFEFFHGDQAQSSSDWDARGQQLIQDMLSGESSVRVELLSAEQMNGALGAFAAVGATGVPTIMLNKDWVEGGAAIDAITKVLVEETGHWMDSRLNQRVDTRGDEGEAFAAYLTGQVLSDADQARLALENDSTTLLVDDKALKVELSATDTDGDGVADTLDLDDDNDGILDTEEQRVIGATPITKDNVTFSYAQNTTGFATFHDAASAYKTGDRNDPANLFDGDPLTELRVHATDVYEFGLPRTISAGSSFTLTEANGGNDAKVAVLGSLGTTDANGNKNNATGGGLGWATIISRFNGIVVGGSARTVATVADLESLFIANGNKPLVSTDGKSILLYAGASDATKTFTSSIGIDHFQIVGIGTHGGWADLSVGVEVNTSLDTDSDGVANHLDLDSDNDGISDLYEAVQSSTDDLAVNIDTNVDGTISANEVVAYNTAKGTSYTLSSNGVWSFFGSSGSADDGNSPIDTDVDGIADFIDLDSDADGIPDTVEARPSTSYVTNDGDVRNNDLDGDGVIGLFDSNDSTTKAFGGSFVAPINTDSNLGGDGTTFQNAGSPTGVASGTSGIDYKNATGINTILVSGDNKYAKIKESGDKLVLNMGQSLPAGAKITIVAQERGSTSANLNVVETDANGNPIANSAQESLTFSAKDKYLTLTFTLDVATQYIKLLSSRGDKEIRIDSVSWGYGGSSTAPLPDYVDTDSDNDGNLDKKESGLTLTGNDNNKDGIDDSVINSAVGYQDPDGMIAPSTGSTIDLTTSNVLLNADGTAADVDYRSLAISGSLAVSNLEVNEGSPYGIFTITGATANTSIKLKLDNDNDPATNDATLGTDTLSQLAGRPAGIKLQYSTNGTSWTDYTDGSAITVGTGGLLVRVGIANDIPYEGTEGFRLKVTYDTSTTTNSTFSRIADGGYALIYDDGTGDYWSGNTTISGEPDAPTPSLDDDRPVTIDNVVVNEGSPFGAVFTLNAPQGSILDLSLSTTGTGIGHATLGTDTLSTLQYSVDAGANWVDYTWTGTSGNRPTASDSGIVYVRVPIYNDNALEESETFKLVATRTNGGNTITSIGGLGTIRDDGVGNYWPNNTITPADNQVLDDDTPIEISNVTVNEAAGWAVFEMEGQANQQFRLTLANTGIGSGFAVEGSSKDYGPQLEYLNGTTWQPYDRNINPLISLDNSGHGLIRVAIANDNPAVYEGSETFKVVATSSSGVVSTGGVGTILDDGQGLKYVFNNDGTVTETEGPGAGFDDDRPALTVTGANVKRVHAALIQ